MSARVIAVCERCGREYIAIPKDKAFCSYGYPRTAKYTRDVPFVECGGKLRRLPGPCTECHGTGVVEETKQPEDGSAQNGPSTCCFCNGSGFEGEL